MVLRHTAAVLTGLLAAAGIGLLAGASADERFWLHLVVSGVILLGSADLAVRLTLLRRRAA